LVLHQQQIVARQVVQRHEERGPELARAGLQSGHDLLAAAVVACGDLGRPDRVLQAGQQLFFEGGGDLLGDVQVVPLALAVDGVGDAQRQPDAEAGEQHGRQSHTQADHAKHATAEAGDCHRVGSLASGQVASNEEGRPATWGRPSVSAWPARGMGRRCVS
jgi:hypothetical protein